MKETVRYGIFVFCITLWATLSFILPDFLDNPVHDLQTALTIGAYLAALGFGSYLILSLILLNRHIATVILPLYALFGAGLSYFRVAYHATFTPMVLDATLHTNAGTVAGVISWQLVVWCMLQTAIAIAIVWYRRHRITLSHPWLYALVLFPLGCLFYWGNNRLHQSLNQRYPYLVFSTAYHYWQVERIYTGERVTLPDEVVFEQDSIDIVVVLGEAMRGDHLSLNGYERATCPQLAQREHLTSFIPYSPHTYTATSLPYLLSPADSLHPERSATHHSFIHRLNTAGYHTTWISNQDMGSIYALFIHEADTVIFPNAGKSVFVFDPWYDEQLLPVLDQCMQAEIASRRLYVLHTIGSHWYYDYHVPDSLRRFLPVTDNRIITRNTPQQIINAYDNTVLTLDAFLNQVITRFENRCAVMIYLSDHGEALGEGNQWLHAGGATPTHYPAAIIWYSNRYEELHPAWIAHLLTDYPPQTTAFLYPYVLSVAGIIPQE